MNSFAVMNVAVSRTGPHDTLPYLLDAPDGHVPMTGRPSRSNNQLLSCLPEHEWARLAPYLVPVELCAGETMHVAGSPFRYVYFPLSGSVALHGLVENGNSSVLALVGCEGFVGVSSFMGGQSTDISNATVLSSGWFLRMRGADFLVEFEQSVPLLHLLLRYTQALITQMAQTSVCNRHHTVDNAFSRLLLLSLDRTEGCELLLTHEQVANLLGVRREGVSEAAMRMQRQGLIRYSRGHIYVLDRPGLEAGSCECYQVIKNEYDRLLPMQWAV